MATSLGRVQGASVFYTDMTPSDDNTITISDIKNVTDELKPFVGDVIICDDGKVYEITEVDIDSITVSGGSSFKADMANSATTATSATTAEQLSSSAGDSGLPVYFSDGKPMAVTKMCVASTYTWMGEGAEASGNYSGAFGHLAKATNTDAFCLGENSTASGSQSLAIGSQVNATATNAIAIGEKSNATAINAIAMGAGATAGYANSIAIGNGVSTTAVNQIRLGTQTIGSPKCPIYLNEGIITAADEVTDITYTTTLNNNSWEVISKVSASGLASSVWDVGATKQITLSSGYIGATSFSSATYNVYILGFDHNSDLEGEHLIHFGTFKTTGGTSICLTDDYYNSYSLYGDKTFSMEHWYDTTLYGQTDTGLIYGEYIYGGWSACDMRYDILGSTDSAPNGYGTWKTETSGGNNPSSTCATLPVKNTLMERLPEDLRAVMKPIKKYSDNVGNDSNVSTYITSTMDYLPLLAEYEIFGSRSNANSAEQNYQKQYDYYANGNSSDRVKYRSSNNSSTAYWWLRSVFVGYGFPIYFCLVYTSGSANYGASAVSFGLSPAFAV